MDFIFDKYIFDNEKKALGLFYKYGDEKFVHIIEFPNSLDIEKLESHKREALERSFFYIHIAEGINYYKAYLTSKVKHPNLRKDEADFFNSFYKNGLGELSFRNKKKLPSKIFRSKIKESRNLIPYQHAQGNAILVGGGKDSITSIELLKNKDFKLFSVITDKDREIPIAIKDTFKIAKKEAIVVYRHLSPNLFSLKNVYNGHVPITGNIAFITMAASILYGFNNIILSNESCANSGNIKWKGKIINHQWSKSFEFEKMFDEFIKNQIHPHLNYFSFLRPLSEIHIAKLFSKYKKYHNNFISCNKTFKVLERENKWCCNCDKCRFVFLALAPFMENISDIFGKNLFKDEENIQGYKALIGLTEHKPFDCVGDYEECILAFKLLQNSKYKDTVIVKEINKLIDENYPNINVEELKKKYFTPSNKHNIPDEFFNDLDI